jgi:hypothetical protein
MSDKRLARTLARPVAGYSTFSMPEERAFDRAAFDILDSGAAGIEPVVPALLELALDLNLTLNLRLGLGLRLRVRA